ncbi:dihydropteroate synthase [Moheibacter sediminis]|uniref:Dihydropteroate synthase n=1 Tax=Moheibacter sediminis TaxID=1434700 RepID=A0A1W2B4F6_9FLAO|nr:dihydropteroate synthase [Moheibacter sediminis]SMC67724.1 dihydropteroate synthase [Moheibacter sediminis]
MQINCKGKLVDLSQPKVMGILNITPDSFYDGGKNIEIQNALNQVETMLNQSADFVDIGGISTRPGSTEVSENEELNRVIPIVESILKEFPEILISVDTYRSKVAKESIQAGAAIINDISAGNLDEHLLQTVVELKVPYVLMHMQGKPKTMQQNPIYENVAIEVNQFFSEKINELKQLGINDIILDPGFGFGKTVEHNYELMKNLDLIGFDEFPLLVGVSRKSMVTRLLDLKPSEALNGTSLLNFYALQKGAKILRVHDVKEAKEAIKIWEMLQ